MYFLRAVRIFYFYSPAAGNKTQEAQFLLKAMGYDIRYPDGFQGPGRTMALEDFQRKHNLQISGAADDQTLIILREQAKKSFLRKEKQEEQLKK